VFFKGREITNLSPERICHLGIARTFQIPAIFPSMNVYENVLVGAAFGKRTSLSTKSFASSWNLDASFGRLALEALDKVGLLQKKDVQGKNLTLYEIKLVMLASALATNPILLLLDEPVGGLGVSESNKFVQLLKKLNGQGLTILLIEHRMEVMMKLSTRVLIMDHGEKICEGSPEEVSRDKTVIEAYLGVATKN